MTTHLSTRLTWHDRGWDAHVCDCPVDNSSCLVHKFVREARDDDAEMAVRGKPLADLDGFQPPCARDLNAFSGREMTLVHHDPLDWRALPAATEQLPAYSVSPAPYLWLREESVRDIAEEYGIDNLPPPVDATRERGWVNEPKRQRILLDRFWGELDEGRSLVFFYCKPGTPIPNEPKRLLVGASRLIELGKQLYFGPSEQHGSHNPVWNRRVHHGFPSEGVRLPLQEYLSRNLETEGIVCGAPDDAFFEFSYVAAHVPDDVAVGALEALVAATEAVKRDGHVAGDWDRSLGWLDEALAEAWSGRGLLPGVGSVLRSLGMQRGIAFQRAELSDPSLSRADLWEKTEKLLDGYTQPEDEATFYNSLKTARQTWRSLPEGRRRLLEQLARFEFSEAQVSRISEPRKRAESGLPGDETLLIDNPYLLFEQDFGTAESERIAIDTVDRGFVLDAAHWPGEERPNPGDLRRVRASMVAELEGAAEGGDTFLPLSELLQRVEDRFVDRRKCPTDRDVILGSREFLGEMLAFEGEDPDPLVSLLPLRDDEALIRGTAERRWGRVNDPPDTPPDWAGLLARNLEQAGASALSPDAEDRAREEKVRALETLRERRLSVLTGRAGTGKTSVLKALLDGLEESEGREAMLLLAPTGKASVRLAAATERRAQTIHGFLFRNEWIERSTLRVKREGGATEGATTVVIDEASMIATDLLAATLRALDVHRCRRLVFVGDPNQLPPIGPGRPFVDLISWLEDDEERSACIARLTERARHEQADSRALRLADGFLGKDAPPGDDELLSEVARGISDGDLAVSFYESAGVLRDALTETIHQVIAPAEGEAKHKAFTHSIGGSGPTGERAEAWQVLSPLRVGSGGTDDLNRQIQMRFKGGLLNQSRRGRTTFGDEEIIWTDKVIQITNRVRQGWPRQTGLDYVANGEIGVVTGTDRDGAFLDVAFSTQRDVTYRYWGDDAGEQLRLAYAVTVHKAQGSDFDVVIVILPAEAPTLSRELLYTALTRFRKRMVLLIERDSEVLAEFRRPEHSEVANRNTNLFSPQYRPASDRGVPFPSRLIHQADDGTMVRSKSELVVLQELLKLDLSVNYEVRLEAPGDPEDFRLPDFTVSFEGDTYFWEHLGMLHVPSYRRSWERKRSWYEKNGYAEQLITSADGPGAGLSAPEIRELAETRIVQGRPRVDSEPGWD